MIFGFITKKSINNRGFTLIELLIVIAIIGILAAVILVNISSVKLKARDAARLSDMAQIQKALEAYFIEFGQYPPNLDNDCSGWDTGTVGDVFIQDLVTRNVTNKVPVDQTNTGCSGYRYYRYTPGAYGCDSARGSFYVLMVQNMESVIGVHPKSPGWSCSGLDWNTLGDWVVGKYEN